MIPTFLAVLIASSSLQAQTTTPSAATSGQSTASVRYRIEARVDPTRRTVSAHADFTWRNDGDAASDLQFCFGEHVHVESPAMPAHVERRVARGQTVTLPLEWTVILPSGAGTDILADQWYPQLATREGGNWACHPAPGGRTAYAQPADFDVEVTAPREWTIGAAGRELAPRDSAGERTHRYQQRHVRAFVWAASAQYVEVTGRSNDVDVTLLLKPEHARQGPRLLDGAIQALADYADWFGAYPDDHLTVVDVPWQSGLGGFAYPRLLTVHLPWLPTTALASAAEIAKGLAFQWWGGTVGIDGAQDGALAEGLTEYSKSLTVERLFNRRHQQLAYSAYEDRYFGGFVPWLFDRVWLESRTAGVGYRRAPLAFATLERYIGWPALQRTLATTVERYRDRPLSRSEFSRTMSDVVGQDLSWFVDATLGEGGAFDYSIGRLTSASDTRCAPSCARTTVVARRLGDAEFSGTAQAPLGAYQAGRALTLLVSFADGRTAVETWDGRAPTRDFVFLSRAPAVSAQIDPDRMLLLDLRNTNNSWTTKPQAPRAARRWSATWLIWLEDCLLSYASLA
jgi:hypothetical protein